MTVFETRNVRTYQSMKGLEAEHIILPEFPDGNPKNPIDINTWFVACTRGKTGLTIYCQTQSDGSLPEPLCNFNPDTYKLIPLSSPSDPDTFELPF